MKMRSPSALRISSFCLFFNASYVVVGAVKRARTLLIRYRLFRMLELAMRVDRNYPARRIVPRSNLNVVSRRAARRISLRQQAYTKPSRVRFASKKIGDCFSWRGWPTLLSIAGLLTLLIGFETLRQNRDASENQRYESAVAHLASDKYVERIAALQTLDGIAAATPERAPEIGALVSEFISARRSEIVGCSKPWKDVLFAIFEYEPRVFESRCLESDGRVIGVAQFGNLMAEIPLSGEGSSKIWMRTMRKSQGEVSRVNFRSYSFAG